MLAELRKLFYWKGVRKDVSEFVSRYLVCQKVKFERLKNSGLLQPLPVLDWKWDSVSMDFVVNLSRTQIGNDVIWVIVVDLINVMKVIPMRGTWGT